MTSEERIFLTTTDTGRIVLLDIRQAKLHRIAENMYPGLKFDWHSFPMENLAIRYSKKGRRFKRLQRIYRAIHEEKTKLVNKVLEK